MNTTTKQSITPEEVIDIVCQFYELDVDRVIKRNSVTGRHYRSAPYAKGRQFICYWMFKNTYRSLSQIGALMEGLNHSTVIHSINTVSDEMNLYSRYKSEIFALNQLIQEKERNLVAA